MPRSSHDSPAKRKLRFEQFEQRLVMSAQAVAPAIVEMLPEMELAAPAITGQDVVWQQSEQGNPATDAAELAAQYGLDGRGQTVAIIDSGIAWDHYALGGGFGQGHKVVGGWDFAENDANPYDDGPAGYHGTHVAGIVGSQDAQYRGVSSGVDLVSLRVFDDQGAGNLDWVEQALQWVQDHQHDFENPITTVNLSLGTGWNPETTPGWGQLENEFAALKQSGIFISVAAGNSFRSIGDVGLSYPAASQHVVPVASHDAEGQLSDFSQRDQRALVAPGEMLRSPVPNHLFGGTQSGQFLASSGTSMAAPWVAGASAILRQANEFMGHGDMNQDQLYQQFMASADQIYDSVTGRNYSRINLGAALEQVIADEYASTLSDATQVGGLNNGDQITGTIGRLDDVDAVKFTATQSGRMTLTIEATHELAPELQMMAPNLQINGNEISFDAVAGQEYGFLLSTTSGTGHYEISVGYQQAGTAAESLGAVTDQTVAGQTENGQQRYSMSATRTGLLTVQAASRQDPVQLQVYDQQMRLVAQSMTAGDVRLDIDAQSGQNFTVVVNSQTPSNEFQLRATNLVGSNQGTVSLHGTHGEDTFSIRQDAGWQASINGVEYSFNAAQVNRLLIQGHQGQDSIDINLGASQDSVLVQQSSVFVSNQLGQVQVDGIEQVSLHGGAGDDSVRIERTADYQWLQAGPESDGSDYGVTLVDDQQTTNVSGFEIVHVINQSGLGEATLVGTSGDDTFVSRGTKSILRNDGMTLVAEGFDQVAAYGGGGQDRTNLFGTTGADRFELGPRWAQLVSQSTQVQATGFAQINVLGGDADDTLSLRDSSGQDSFLFRDREVVLQGSNYGIYASGFGNVALESNGGWDIAQIHGTTGNDFFSASAGTGELIAGQINVRVNGVENIGFLAGQGGVDRANIFGSDQDDHVSYQTEGTRIASQHHVTRAIDVEHVTLDLRAGNDSVDLRGSAGRDQLNARDDSARFQSSSRTLDLSNFEALGFDGGGGRDRVSVEGRIDLLSAVGDQAEAVLDQYRLQMESFSFLEASTVDDALADYDLEAVDFTYMLRGNWNHD